MVVDTDARLGTTRMMTGRCSEEHGLHGRTPSSQDLWVPSRCPVVAAACIAFVFSEMFSDG